MKRVQMIKSFMQGKILDVGCNEGFLHRYLLETGMDIHGLDQRRTEFKENVTKGDAEKMPFRGGSFDTIIGGELMEHLRNPDKFLSESFRVLRKGGILILTTPNRDAWLNLIAGNYYHKEPQKKYKFQNHIHIFNETELKEAVSKAGFRLVFFDYLPYDLDGVGGDRITRLIYLRKLIHHLVPSKNRENMFLVAKKVTA
jgi:2-polyprenyl-3-methyl-5-hydroxy-6-metoxy-1,4-benzoquinol methylase